LNPASRRPREGWGVDISNPDEMAACLSMVPVPFAIIDLVMKIEQVNKEGGDFYIDFEFAPLPRLQKGEVAVERIPVEIAVLRLDRQIVIDTPIKYNQSIPELLAGVPRTGTPANFTWGVMWSTYGQEEETWGKTWDETVVIIVVGSSRCHVRSLCHAVTRCHVRSRCHVMKPLSRFLSSHSDSILNTKLTPNQPSNRSHKQPD
jgi:hypothetical protein